MDGHGGVAPPAPSIGGYPRRRAPTHATRHQLTEHGLPAFLLLEWVGPQPVTDPLIEFTHPPGCIGNAEVSAPTEHVRAKALNNLHQAAPPGSPCNLTNSTLQHLKRLGCNPNPTLLERSDRIGVAGPATEPAGSGRLSTVGMPNFRSPPLGFGIQACRTGFGW